MKERYFFVVVEVQLQGKLHQKVFFGAKCLKMKARPQENCSKITFWILASLALHPKASSCLKHFKLKARRQKKKISDLERFEQQGGKWVEICCIFRCHLPASQHKKDLSLVFLPIGPKLQISSGGANLPKHVVCQIYI
jgi:hypothetical protein